jgi:hypothetical protein
MQHKRDRAKGKQLDISSLQVEGERVTELARKCKHRKDGSNGESDNGSSLHELKQRMESGQLRKKQAFAAIPLC